MNAQSLVAASPSSEFPNLELFQVGLNRFNFVIPGREHLRASPESITTGAYSAKVDTGFAIGIRANYYDVRAFSNGNRIPLSLKMLWRMDSGPTREGRASRNDAGVVDYASIQSKKSLNQVEPFRATAKLAM